MLIQLRTKHIACDMLAPSAVAIATYFQSRECASSAERFFLIGNPEEFPIKQKKDTEYSSCVFLLYV